MVQQLLHGAAVRAAHEIAWMHDELDAIRHLASETADASIVPAMRRLDALDSSSLHLAQVQARYDAAGHVLSKVIEAAFSTGDARAVERARELLQARSAHEMQIVGQLDLVGRG